MGFDAGHVTLTRCGGGSNVCPKTVAYEQREMRGEATKLSAHNDRSCVRSILDWNCYHGILYRLYLHCPPIIWKCVCEEIVMITRVIYYVLNDDNDT